MNKEKLDRIAKVAQEYNETINAIQDSLFDHACAKLAKELKVPLEEIEGIFGELT